MTTPKSLPHLLREFSAPLLAVLFAISGSGFYTTFITLHFANSGASSMVIGWVQSVYFLGLFIGGWKIERLIYRIGHIQTLAVFGSLLTASILVQSLTQSVPIWLVTRFAAGLSLAALYIVIECWMLDHSADSQRGVVLGLYALALNAGYAAGQYMLARINLDGSVPFLLAALLSSCSVIPAALSTRKISIPEHTPNISIKTLFKLSPHGTTNCLLSGLLISSLYSFLALVNRSYALPPGELMMVFILGGLCVQWPLGRLSDLVDRRLMLFGVNLAAVTVCLVIVAGYPPSSSLIALLLFLLGGVIFPIYPISVTQVTERIARTDLTATTANLLIVYGVGSVFGPLISAQAFQRYDAVGFYLLIAAINCVGVVMGIQSLLTRRAVPEEQQAEFIPMPRTTPVVFEMDPRENEPHE